MVLVCVHYLHLTALVLANQQLIRQAMASPSHHEASGECKAVTLSIKDFQWSSSSSRLPFGHNTHWCEENDKHNSSLESSHNHKKTSNWEHLHFHLQISYQEQLNYLDNDFFYSSKSYPKSTTMRELSSVDVFSTNIFLILFLVIILKGDSNLTISRFLLLIAVICNVFRGFIALFPHLSSTQIGNRFNKLLKDLCGFQGVDAAVFKRDISSGNKTQWKRASDQHSHVVNEITSESIVYSQGLCDEGWTLYKSKCYRVYSPARIFDYAQKACTFAHANIASIHSVEEDKYIYSLINKEVDEKEKVIWLGMERVTPNFQMIWNDKTQINYTNWLPGEPNLNGACVGMLRNGYWIDEICTQKHVFICKKYEPELSYTRTQEILAMVLIPVIIVIIMSTLIIILFRRSVKHARGTVMAYGTSYDRSQQNFQSDLITVTTSIGGLAPERYVDSEAKSFRRKSLTPSQASRDGSRRKSSVKPPTENNNARSSSRDSSVKSNTQRKNGITSPTLSVSTSSEIKSSPAPRKKSVVPEVIVSDQEGSEIERIECPNPELGPDSIDGNLNGGVHFHHDVDFEMKTLSRKSPRKARRQAVLDSNSSLNNLIERDLFRPKSRRLRGLRPESCVSNTGKEGKFRKV
uniref:Toxin candidate TRINITY_DN29093_c0_g1_i2.p1 n=1 Tax=Pachycerianthus borealis TaxID=2736680 RepID=A0A7G7WYV2_9CNID|nr:toxin candidate TRINITY_DN29093_c0_g1_i2.p1 [Pachycerianthus borealis]